MESMVFYTVTGNRLSVIGTGSGIRPKTAETE